MTDGEVVPGEGRVSFISGDEIWRDLTLPTRQSFQIVWKNGRGRVEGGDGNPLLKGERRTKREESELPAGRFGVHDYSARYTACPGDRDERRKFSSCYAGEKDRNSLKGSG